LKLKKVHYIQKVNEYFKKEEFAKKWKENKISTFDYLLLLNKLTSRSYNDPNQYPVMPWLFLEEGTNLSEILIYLSLFKMKSSVRCIYLKQVII
jgi:hypothetical protein